jgi:hypothetical protein
MESPILEIVVDLNILSAGLRAWVNRLVTFCAWRLSLGD